VPSPLVSIRTSRGESFKQSGRGRELAAGEAKRPYVDSEVFDLKPTSGLYSGSRGVEVLGNWARPQTDRCSAPENSAHLSNFLTPRTVSAGPYGAKD
jgi:hypothetical protein